MRAGSFLSTVAVAVCLLVSLPAFAQDAMEGEAMMESGEVSFVAHHKVADFEKWLPSFESHADFRENAGCTSISVYQDAADPNQVTVIGTFESMEKAQAFASSEELKAAMEAAGVMGPPELHFLYHHKDYAH